ncbi:unnamed protein product [Hermetia illucens]|uniref:DUF7805 domain-containing protein n=2 Tax=Hermetia illucens TaxID=343691 RepID=A0A7R8YSY2_HERIL|nr:unnamed protein product [Hermetia illucens]
MLIAFHSSPFSAPLQSGIPNRGFELDVDILFADSDSSDFAQGSKNLCEFHINASNPDDVLLSRRGRMGRIVSPRHTLPPNTTCTYYFHGYPGDLIWLSFTSFNLQILQQAIHDNNTLGRADLPPWIIRLRMWDSYGTYIPVKSTTTTAIPSSTSGIGRSGPGTVPGGVISTSINNAINNTGSYGNYYYSAQNPKYGKAIQVNIDNAWNPVDTYIYGPTQPSIYNQENKYGGYLSQKFGNGISSVRESFNYIAGERYEKGSKDSGTSQTREGGGAGGQRSGGGSGIVGATGKHKRRLMLEIYDYETPKLCDHTAITSMTGHKLRPCSPLESYVSSGRDLKMEFHTHTGTALYPAQFSLNYEFVDTELGGEPWAGRRGEDPVPPLCSRIFRKRKGNIQAPRNVFLYGRGGARNLTCLYRFEAGLNERVQLVLHNVSFGDGSGCSTDTDLHTGRPKCSYADPESRLSELKVYDVPFRDVKIPLGCFCDNTTALYNAPVSFLSNSRIMELTFSVTRLNITEDFADVYFYASYEFKRYAECRKKTRLKGAGGEDEIKYPFISEDSSCEGNSWYLEAQQLERSLFVQTWGTYLPIEPTSEDSMRCATKNRLMIYSGRPWKVMRVICPSLPGPRPSSLHIFSEDWTSGHGLSVFSNKPVSLVLEPIFKEPGVVSFTWLEIQRTKASLIQQLDIQTNFTANETLGEFGLYPRDADCEYKCPELDACISELLWCDGHRNCPSGFDESEEECGTARKLLELPGGIFAALGCIAAAIAACLIFCIFGLMRKRKKSMVQKTVLNGTLSKKDMKKDPLFLDPGS